VDRRGGGPDRRLIRLQDWAMSPSDRQPRLLRQRHHRPVGTARFESCRWRSV
jgi:hypothetical protein